MEDKYNSYFGRLEEIGIHEVPFSDSDDVPVRQWF